MASWLLWRAQRAVPRAKKDRGRAAKPMSIYQNYLALRRVFKARDVELTPPHTVLWMRGSSRRHSAQKRFVASCRRAMRRSRVPSRRPAHRSRVPSRRPAPFPKGSCSVDSPPYETPWVAPQGPSPKATPSRRVPRVLSRQRTSTTGPGRAMGAAALVP